MTDMHDNWREEKRSAYLYRFIAQYETNEIHRTMFIKLADAAEKQAKLWEKQAEKNNIKLPASYRPDLRTIIIVKLIKHIGPRALRSVLAAIKVRGMSIYNSDETAEPAIRPMPKTVEEVGRRHGTISTGNNIRAAVFGINDGLVSNASLILGMAGAQSNNHIILLAGIAGLLAGACSMGAGEYVSVNSQREMLEYQLNLEREELELYPQEEAAELTLIYTARGVPEEDAAKLAQTIIKNPEKALETLAREELGLNPNDLVSPWGAAISSFLSFTIGALIPLFPFIFNFEIQNLPISITLTGISLFIVGAILSLFTGKNAIISGLRMLLIGAGAGTLTYFIGNLLQVGLG